MFLLEKPIPAFLISKSNITKTILFTAIFALAFINIYAPFGVNFWFDVSEVQLFFYSSLVILTGVLVIVLSRIIMFYYTRKKPINYLQYFAWVLAEIFSMSTVYTIFVKFFFEDQRLLPEIFKASAKNTALVLLLPYLISWLYISWREKTDQLEKLTDEKSEATNTKTMIPFYDEKGNLRFSVHLKDILYLEASDNYVEIFYTDVQKIARYLVRDTLKSLEQKLEGTGIIRCHRSYLVNFERVRILRKEKDGLKLELDVDQKCFLPVSKTYLNPVIEAFSKYTP